MTDVRTVSLPDDYSDWVDEHVDSLSEFVQNKIQEEMSTGSSSSEDMHTG